MKKFSRLVFISYGAYTFAGNQVTKSGKMKTRLSAINCRTMKGTTPLYISVNLIPGGQTPF
ncbi:uncharacterized protein METZ01_LOCUS403073, partial [marine metagenome]